MRTAGCLVVMYHYVRDATRTVFPEINALSLADFHAQLDWLTSRFAPTSLADLEALLAACKPVPKPCALLTFDDGFIDHFETVFPALRERGWGGVFFLVGAALDDPPRVLNVHKAHFLLAKLGADRFAALVKEAVVEAPVGVGRALARHSDAYRYDDLGEQDAKHLLNYGLPYETADAVLNGLFAKHVGEETEFARHLYVSAAQVREMARAGMVFGFHTERHRVLSRLSAREQRAELCAGVARIRELTGQSSVPFCYPFGHRHTYDGATLKVLGESGYSLAFNTVRRMADPAADSRYELPRVDTRDLPPLTGHTIPYA